MLSGVLVQQHGACRVDNTVVLGTDDIFQQDGTCTLVLLYLGIKRQVQGDDLDTGIGLSGIVQCIAGEDVRPFARLELLEADGGEVALRAVRAISSSKSVIGLRRRIVF